MSGGGAYRLVTQHCISGGVHYNCEGLCQSPNEQQAGQTTPYD